VRRERSQENRTLYFDPFLVENVLHLMLFYPFRDHEGKGGRIRSGEWRGDCRLVCRDGRGGDPLKKLGREERHYRSAGGRLVCRQTDAGKMKDGSNTLRLISAGGGKVAAGTGKAGGT